MGSHIIWFLSGPISVLLVRLSAAVVSPLDHFGDPLFALWLMLMLAFTVLCICGG